MLAFTIIIAAIFILLWMATRPPPGYPPGPFRWPIIGSLLLMRALKKSQGFHHLSWSILAHRYGPIVGLKLGQVDVVLVASPEMVRKVGSNPHLQGRPDGFFYRLRANFGRGGLVFNEGASWLEQKRFCMQHLREFGLGKEVMGDLIEKEAEILVEWIGSAQGKPLLMERPFEISVVNILWAMMAGKRYSRDDTELNNICVAINESFRLSDMSGGLLNQLPFLRFIAPKFCGYAAMKLNMVVISAFLQKTIYEHKASRRPGEVKDLIDAILEDMVRGNKETNFSDNDLYCVCLDFLQAGMDTTSNTLSFFVLYMIMYPDAQKKMQQEIDRVVGRERVPKLEDRDKMPYTTALIMEVQRLSNIAPGGVAHRATQDTELGGYTIPVNTILLTLLHDVHTSSVWGSSVEFSPERFLACDGKMIISPNAFMPFGTGRRKCVGEVLAKANVFVFATSLFQVFSVAAPDGTEKLHYEIRDGVTLCPKPYMAQWTRRIQTSQ